MTDDEILNLLNEVREILDANCITNEDSYFKFLDLVIEGKFGIFTLGSIELKKFLKEENNLVNMLSYISVMYAFHPYFADAIYTSPSVQMVEKALRNYHGEKVN